MRQRQVKQAALIVDRRRAVLRERLEHRREPARLQHQGQQRGDRGPAGNEGDALHRGRPARSRMAGSVMRPRGAPSAAATGRLCAPRHSRSDNASRNVAFSEIAGPSAPPGSTASADADERQQAKRALAAADQPLDEPRRGLRQKLRGRRILQQAAAVHHGDAVAKLDRFLQIMGHQHDGDVQAALQRQQILARLRPDDGIERAERLVHQQQRGLGRERPGDADALLLAS